MTMYYRPQFSGNSVAYVVSR